MSACVAAHDDGWAIFAEPPGRRDLGCPDLWWRSMERSRLRRERAAASARVMRTRHARMSAALTAATLLAPVTSQALAQQSTATTSVTGSLLKKGSRGPAVAAAQRALGIPADGIFGRQTKRAVKAFQASHGLAVDGVIGPLTSAALRQGGTGTSGAVSGPKPSAAVTTAIQGKLGIPADGVFGPQTRRAVKAFQAARGLIVDGIVGPQTLAALGMSGSAPAASPGAGAGTIVAAARSKVGLPYETAGVGPNGFDCSGLTQYALRQAGIEIPRTSYAQFGVGVPVSRAAIQAGDLVFFNTDGGGASHVGIATSNATVISATTHGVREHAIGDSYWGSHYVGARRVG